MAPIMRGRRPGVRRLGSSAAWRERCGRGGGPARHGSAGPDGFASLASSQPSSSRIYVTSAIPTRSRASSSSDDTISGSTLDEGALYQQDLTGGGKVGGDGMHDKLLLIG